MPQPQTPAFAEPRPQHASITVDELGHRTELAAVGDEWETLFASAPSATPFQSAEWLLPWLELFGGGELLALTARAGGALVGLAPLQLTAGPLGRTVSFIGHGPSDYGGILAAPGYEAAVATAFLDRLAARRAAFDACDLDQLPPTDPLYAAPVPEVFSDESTDREVCPFLPLPRTSVELDGCLQGHFGKRVRQYRRRLEREPGFAFDRADERNGTELIEAFIALHTARWTARHQPGVLADERIRELHRRAAAGMLQRGRLRMHAVRARGGVVAVIYAFAHGKRVCFYLSGFDPALAALDVATVALWRAITVAIDDGFQIFDFLRGGEPYKYRWGARDRWNRRRVLRPRGPSV